MLYIIVENGTATALTFDNGMVAVFVTQKRAEKFLNKNPKLLPTHEVVPVHFPLSEGDKGAIIIERNPYF